MKFKLMLYSLCAVIIATTIFAVYNKNNSSIIKHGKAIEFIEQDQKFSFGKILKSNTARALRRTKLEEEDKKRIRQRLVSMLLTGNIPHEYKQYVKLLKKVGLENYRENLEESINRSNQYVMKYFNYLIDVY